MKLILILTMTILASCASKPVYTDGEYESLSKDNHLNPIFNESDWIKVSKEFSQNFQRCSSHLPDKKVKLNLVHNLTSEHINTIGLKNRMLRQLQDSNELKFTMDTNYPLQIVGEISNITQIAKGENTLYYKLTYHLTKGTEILCTTEVEFRKRYLKY